MNPGKFERKIQPLTHTLNTMVDDDDTMRAIVNIIFDEVSKSQYFFLLLDLNRVSWKKKQI